MTLPDITKLSLEELLALNGSILVELRRRNVCRTENNPTGDYAEYLIAKKLNLDLKSNSKLGFDATDSNGLRYQIKGRRVTQKNRSRQLGVIRDLDKQQFDYLVGMIFDENYLVNHVLKIPHGIIGEYAKYSDHQRGHILHLRGKILSDNRAEDITTGFVVV